MQNYRCWRPEEQEEEDGIEIVDADDAGFSASCACKTWQESGCWSGDIMPDSIVVSVRGTGDGLIRTFEITPMWEVEFYSRCEITKP